MNTGIVSSRYARALLKYTRETGRGAEVCAQVEALLRDPENAPRVLEPELQRFVALVSSNGRLDHVKLMLTTFVRMYYESEGICQARLVTVTEAEGLEDRIRTMLEKQTGLKVILSTSVDPSLIGGFTLEVGDYLLDASVRNQIERIRREFIISNNRIV